LAIFKGTLYIAWLEAGEKEWNKLYIKHWNGSEWLADGEGFGLKPGHTILSPVLLFGENEGHLAWSEAGENGVFQIWYAAWNKEKWTVYPETLNKNPGSQAFNPAMILFKGVPWLAFQERDPGAAGFRLHLLHLEGGKWQNDNHLLPDGGATGKLDPALGTRNETLFLAWEERNVKGVPGIFVRQLLPGTKENRVSPLNLAADSFGMNPSFLSEGNDLYLSWKENNSGDIFQNHVARFSEK
ncbi:MAG TPA: hypothetical protein VN944_08680, partial [Nitrospiria bacterium]|nr:hypothetical protein [Nitrospiria bacterium]